MNKKRTSFTHIKQIERDEIFILSNKGYSIRDIARALSRSPSAIFYEINRNRTKGVYDPHRAQQKTKLRRRYASFRGEKNSST